MLHTLHDDGLGGGVDGFALPLHKHGLALQEAGDQADGLGDAAQVDGAHRRAGQEGGEEEVVAGGDDHHIVVAGVDGGEEGDGAPPRPQDGDRLFRGVPGQLLGRILLRVDFCQRGVGVYVGQGRERRV